MIPFTFLSIPFALLFLAQATESVVRAEVDTTPPCRMIVVVHEGVITDFNCQGGETECDAIEHDTPLVCTPNVAGTVDERETACKCCEEDLPTTCIGSTVPCAAIVHEPAGQHPFVYCFNVFCSENTTCDYVLTGVESGAVECPCR